MVPIRRAERYTIGQSTEGAVITMCQNREALTFASIAGIIFFASLWFGPGVIPNLDGWFYALWCALFGVFTLLGVMGAMYRERWVISDREIIVTDTFSWARRRVPREPRLRIHLDASGAAVGGAVFGYEVEFDDQGGQPLVPRFRFSTATGAGDFIEALRLILPVDLDLPARHGPLRDGPDNR